MQAILIKKADNNKRYFGKNKLVWWVETRVSQKTQKSEFWNATYPSGFHRVDEPTEKTSASYTHKRDCASHF